MHCCNKLFKVRPTDLSAQQRSTRQWFWQELQETTSERENFEVPLQKLQGAGLILPVTWTYRTFFAFFTGSRNILSSHTKQKALTHLQQREIHKIRPGPKFISSCRRLELQKLNSRCWIPEVEPQQSNLRSSEESPKSVDCGAFLCTAMHCRHWPVPLSYLKTTSAKRCLDIFEQKAACFPCVLVCDRISRRSVWYAARSTASADVPAQLAV